MVERVFPGTLLCALDPHDWHVDLGPLSPQGNHLPNRQRSAWLQDLRRRRWCADHPPDRHEDAIGLVSDLLGLVPYLAMAALLHVFHPDLHPWIQTRQGLCCVPSRHGLATSKVGCSMHFVPGPWGERSSPWNGCRPASSEFRNPSYDAQRTSLPRFLPVSF